MNGHKQKIYFSALTFSFLTSIIFAQESNLDDLEKRLRAAKKNHAEKVEYERKAKAEAARKAEEVRKTKLEEAARKAEAERIATEEAALKAKFVAVGGLEFIDIPGGTFQMGSNAGTPDEKPVHLVNVTPFRLMKYEVTFAQWDLCVNDGGCKGYRPDDDGWGRDSRPVINVSWQDAQSYVKWINKKIGIRFRLPSEDEWEYAARAGTTTDYPWGTANSRDYANYGKDKDVTFGKDQWEFTASVGSFPANAFGLHDLHGNVEEWVDKCWPWKDDYGAPSGSADSDGSCVTRGGSWRWGLISLRSSRRGRVYPSYRGNYTGFRLAADL